MLLLAVTALGEGGISTPLIPRAAEAGMALVWDSLGSATPQHDPTARHWVSSLIYVFLCVYIYIKSCVCVHVYAYPHVYIAHCGFTEKCESSWPQ